LVARAWLLLFHFPGAAAPLLSILSLHDALPISLPFCRTDAKPAPISTPFTALMDIIADAISASSRPYTGAPHPTGTPWATTFTRDRKSTRLNSSHVKISYAVFCLKKKKTNRPKSWQISMLYLYSPFNLSGIHRVSRKE